MPLLALHLVAINLLAFAAFAIDKRRASAGSWRVPEKTLLTIALLGGGLGAVGGQQVFRHKTRKEPFRTILWTTTAAQLGGAGWLAAHCQ
jgi:uncharacterized membrane protein YsdA (DUF1294 family)